jgi:uroporphyrinogen III methyltransferase/synthase
MSGIVHLVGAGPGDPELITVRGRRLLESADAVVHDRLVGRAVLELIPAGTLRIDVGKAGYGHAVPQSEINAMLVRLARAGLVVVRLKGGDPFVFGRGGEEAVAVRAAGISFEVVPGVTAGLAGPAFAGIPVTHRGVARSVAFVTGHEDTASGGPPVDWEALARVDTLVVFMAGRTAAAVAARLLAAGRRPDTPAALVIEASLPSQEVRRCDLASLAAAGGGSTDGRAALLVVGPAVALHRQLAWFAPTPLELTEVPS